MENKHYISISKQEKRKTNKTRSKKKKREEDGTEKIKIVIKCGKQ